MRGADLRDIGLRDAPGIEGIGRGSRQAMQHVKPLAQAPQRARVVIVSIAPATALQVLHDQQALLLRRGIHQRRGNASRGRNSMQRQLAHPIDTRTAPGGAVQAQHEAPGGAIDPKNLIDGATAQPLDAPRGRTLRQAGHARQRPAGRPVQRAC